MSEEYQIYHNYQNWGNSIKEYEQNKKNLEWGYNPKPKIMTHKIVKEKENIFNPISQKYYDESYNNQLKKSENLNIRNTIANNLDMSLRNEQTYNLINLTDKLNGLKSHPDYPIYKNEVKRKKLENTKTDYNILSNITLDKHNYLPPDKRPIINKTQDNKNTFKVSAVDFKDFDIISNNYKFDHENKSKTDKEIAKLNAAKNYWKQRDYDLVQGKFIDDSKEKEFQVKRRDEEVFKSLNKHPGHQEPLYNAVNHIILDKDKLEETENKELEKKMRFKIKYEMENFYRAKNFEKDAKKEKNLESKLSYQRFKNTDNRGYDMINFNNNYNTYKNSIKLKNDVDKWEAIIEKSGDNNTLHAKGVYKDPFDFTDNEKIAQQFKINRSSIIF